MKKFFAMMLVLVMTLTILPSVVFAAKPSAPSITSYTAISSSSLTIKWGAVSGATKYRVDRRRTDEDAYKTLTKTHTSTSYTDSGLKSGSTYYYRVYAINGDGTSAKSVTYETHTMPEAPVISNVVRDSDTQLTINWNSVNGATKYKIMYRRGDKEDYETLVSNATGTSYIHKNLTPGSRYWYRVYAIREGDVGPEGGRTTKNITSERSETVGEFTKIARPSSWTDNNNTSFVNFKWTETYGNSNYSYDIYRKSPTDSDFVRLARTTDLTYSDKGLTSGIIYQYKIITVVTDTGAICTRSDPFFAGPKITEELSVKPYGNSSMIISWNKPMSETGLTYTIMKSADGTADTYYEYATTNDTYFIDRDLEYGKSYRYYVVVKDTSGNYLTSTFGKSATLKAPDLGNEFYASIVVKTNKMPIAVDNTNNVVLSNINDVNSLWKFTKDSDGSYKIASVANGLVLDAYGWGNENETNITVCDAHDDNKANQRWFLHEYNGGYVIMPSYNMNILVDVAGGDMFKGTNIQLYTRNNTASQVFTLIKSNNTQISGPVVSVKTGDSDTETIFEWNRVPSAAYYKGTVYKDGAVYQEFTTSETTYGMVLPAYNYSVVITALNTYEAINGDWVPFSIGCVHSYSEWTEISKATCIADGMNSRSCTKCGNVETEIKSKTGHLYSEIVSEATCTENGFKYSECVRCKERINEETLSAKGHSYPDDWTEDAKATCTQEGKEHRECITCKAVETRSVETTDHNYITTFKKEPVITDTGVEAGLVIYVCEYCEDKIEEILRPEKNGGIVAIGSAIAQKGDIITIPVTIQENPGIAGFAVNINYDNNVLAPIIVSDDQKYITRGDVLKFGTLTSSLERYDESEAETLNKVQISWSNTINATSDGVLFNISFRIKNAAVPGYYPIKITYPEENGGIADGSGYNIIPITNDGVITVSDGVIKGDVNQDMRVDAHDAILLSRYLAFWKLDPFTQAQIDAADLYKDQKITTKDGVRLAQILADYKFTDETEEAVLADGEETTITVGDCFGLPGDYIDVPFTVTNNNGMAGFGFKISYDKTILAPTEIISGDMIEMRENSISSNLQQIQSENGDASTLDYLSVYWTDKLNLKDDGILFKVRFKIRDTAEIGSKSSVEISYDTGALCGVNGLEITDVNAVLNSGEVNVANVFDYKYKIENTSVNLISGTPSESIPKNGDCILNVSLKAIEKQFASAIIIVASYDENGAVILLNSKKLTEAMLDEGVCSIYIDESNSDIAELRVFVWDSFDGLIPLADTQTVN